MDNMDWLATAGSEEMMDTDDDDVDDEEEIRKFDAVLEEDEIDERENCSVVTPGWTRDHSSQYHLGTGQSPSLTSPQLPSVSPYSPEQLEQWAHIDGTIAVNKEYEAKTRQLQQVLVLRLQECRKKILDVQTSAPDLEKTEVFRYINCGRPYFRDARNRPAPDNPDTIMMKDQMYDFSLLSSVPGWTVNDKNQFTNVMVKVSLEIKKESYNKKIMELKRLLSEKPSKKIEREIAKLRRERDSLNTKSFAELALPLDQEYDWNQLFIERLNRRHTSHEYRCFWKLYFHPSINKSNWNDTEHKALQVIAANNQYQDWDETARQLNTNRTGYQCFVYFRTNMTNSNIGRKWSPEEVTYLKRLVDYFREDSYIPWGKIAAAMENRTKVQIYNKYLRVIEQRKGRFLAEEDAVILNCVEKFGTSFRRMTQFLPQRSMVQIRARYQVLSKMRVSTVWSVDDDRKLLQLMTNEDSKTNFSMATKYFPGRNRINLRSRYITLMKWMKTHPNLDIEHAPRRGARRLNHGQASDDLPQAIENLKNTLSAEVEIRKDRKKITRDSDEQDIEDAIIALLVTEGVKNQDKERSPFEDSLVLPNDTVVTAKEMNTTNLRKCLLLLGATLNKEEFKKSHFSKEYPDLVDANQDVSLIKIKSYSKNPVHTIKFDDTYDVWSKPILGPRTYVFPPHYSTITGCKALMSYVSTYASYCNSINLHVLVRRNPLLKEQMDLLLERFYSLFLWPMLLSNEGPQDFHQSKLCKRDSFYVRPPPLPNAPAITINTQTLKKFKIQPVSDVIDVTEEEDASENVVVEELDACDDVSELVNKIMK